jgi:hypothetical protein
MTFLPDVDWSNVFWFTLLVGAIGVLCLKDGKPLRSYNLHEASVAAAWVFGICFVLFFLSFWKPGDLGDQVIAYAMLLFAAAFVGWFLYNVALLTWEWLKKKGWVPWH